jgi:hypothetical protein
MKFYQPPVTVSLLEPNIFLNVSFSNTINLCYFISVKAHISHQYKIHFLYFIKRGRIVV